MARNEQLIRQHKILEILERVRFGKTIDEIKADVVDELGLTSLHARTIRRDLEALQAAGIDVDVHDSQRGKIWKLGPRARQTHKISATATELIALSVGRQLLYPLAGTPFWMGIESFWNKINEELPDSVLKHYDKFRKTLYVLGVPSKSYEKHHGMLSTINRAIGEHRVVEILYEKTLGEPPVTRFIEPYSLVLFQSNLYIIAADNRIDISEDRVRTWKLDRFQKTTIQDKWFKIPADFDLSQYVGSSLSVFFGNRPRNFKIEISPAAERLIREEPWHPDQSIKALKNGNFELMFNAANEMEIIPRVLQLGAEAEIKSPESTRTLIAEMINKMQQRYK